MPVLSSFADGSLFGARFGQSPASVVALHGWGKDHSDLRAVVEEFDAISLDLPGFGATPAPPAVWDAQRYADAVASALREIRQPVVVLGHSFGGKVAVCLAAQYPDLVRAVVLTGAPVLRRKVEAKRTPLAYRALKQAHRLGWVSDARIEAEKRKRGSADYRAATGVMRDILVKTINQSYESELTQVKCQVEMVWGENDTAAPLSLAREAQALLSNANLEVVADGNHWITNTNPEPIREAIRKCLA